tara:strand:+ start:93 stop:722 length:630 start_codon:yes stop_codon:yes gene_type:complete
MNLLREYIREMLLTEAAKTIQDLPPGVSVVIEPYSSGWNGFEIYFADDAGTLKDVVEAGKRKYKDQNGRLFYGLIAIGDTEPTDGPCGGAFSVHTSSAARGWGPLLYDIAIEIATEKANGLMSDRMSVSNAARNVWDYYNQSRSDVQKHQLDNLENELTPEDADNCTQDVIYKKGNKGIAIQDSPISKRYTKSPSTLSALRSAGKLREL